MNKLDDQEKKGCRYYDRDFKYDAVRRVIQTGKRASEVARGLGIGPGLLARWKREYLQKKDAKAIPQSKKPSEVDAENRRLRRELQDVCEQRDIFKKALIVFAQGPNRGMNS